MRSRTVSRPAACNLGDLRGAAHRLRLFAPGGEIFDAVRIGGTLGGLGHGPRVIAPAERRGERQVRSVASEDALARAAAGAATRRLGEDRARVRRAILARGSGRPADLRRRRRVADALRVAAPHGADRFAQGDGRAVSGVSAVGGPTLPGHTATVARVADRSVAPGVFPGDVGIALLVGGVGLGVSCAGFLRGDGRVGHRRRVRRAAVGRGEILETPDVRARGDAEQRRDESPGGATSHVSCTRGCRRRRTRSLWCRSTAPR